MWDQEQNNAELYPKSSLIMRKRS